MAVGFKIVKRTRKVGADIVERFSRLPVANVSDAMSRMTAGRGEPAPDACRRRDGGRGFDRENASRR
ncbi:hypothetical protein ACVWYK_004296 [Bradyrhizobium sp. USDA 4470]